MPALIYRHQHRHRHQHRVAGFTLVELLIATMIIALLALIAMPSFTAYTQRSRIARCLSAAHMIQTSLAAFTTTSPNDQYPPAIGSYKELAAMVNAHGGNLKATEDQEGFMFQHYTALDNDGDNTWESYIMQIRVLNVSTEWLGWCMTIEPTGVTRCPPQ